MQDQNSSPTRDTQSTFSKHLFAYEPIQVGEVSHWLENATLIGRKRREAHLGEVQITGELHQGLPTVDIQQLSRCHRRPNREKDNGVSNVIWL